MTDRPTRREPMPHLQTRPATMLTAIGLCALIVLMQLALVPTYRSLPFSIGFWSFTFPVAATVVYVIEWLAILAPTGWQLAAWLLVAALTAFIGAIAVRSVRGALPRRTRQAQAPATGQRVGG